ncbi:glucose/arabinose dehydrogenase [Tamaricihabitans halophyticus]|uniref:Glucose/arabinose dehydrogenase n=1 Tax=Tamaricihabitans halophyticus TaxID=1262583 RepID=A0A4R2R9K6_9PSEU|nr:PQQ-dependent sugar dehydrogenase [Tamaricihabitans halophyticus]TCP56361.1 glucose/arabinose dehydrogenase [Tamaricihabitans halophyticus]
MRLHSPFLARPVLALALLLFVSSCTAEPATETETGGATARTTDAPELTVTEVAGGLEDGWDIGFLPDGRQLVPQRSGSLALITNGRVREVQADFSDVLAVGEGGLLGMVLHPDFAESRQFTTCQTYQRDGDAVDVRLVNWELSGDGTRANRVADPLLGGLPVNPSGRHSGCRPTIAQDGALLVGTGDSADPNTSQDRRSLGGKVLRLDLKTGEPLPDNPFADSSNRDERFVYSYGHRNVQGVAVRPDSDQVLLTEHGPDVDDEVNLLRAGGNYGWDPSQGGTEDSYDESVPMTDLERFPDAVRAQWSSGSETQAIAGAAFVAGQRWGRLDGALAVAALKGSKLYFFDLDKAGAVRELSIPEELDDSYGRLRAVRLGPDGDLYVTTSNGSDDTLLRISPAA